MRSTRSRALVCLVAMCVLPGGVASAQPPGSVAVAIDGNFPDPSFVVDGTTYYAYATGGGSRGAFPYATAPSAGGPWTRHGAAMPSVPAWAGPTSEGRYEFWAPSVFRNGDSHVMYFTANNKATDDRCVGVAEAARPAGPFVARPEPLLCHRDAQVIDASSFSEGGQRFVVYKVNRGTSVEIRVNKTDPAGAVLTSPHRTLVVADTNIEAPDLIASGGVVFLFVARGNYTNCTYRTEVWRADSVWDGTWRNAGTLMNSAGTGLCGPGGTEVRRVGGTTWMVFHGWKCADAEPDCRPGDAGEKRRYRAMYTGRVGWGADGRTPRVLDHR